MVPYSELTGGRVVLGAVVSFGFSGTVIVLIAPDTSGTTESGSVGSPVVCPGGGWTGEE